MDNHIYIDGIKMLIYLIILTLINLTMPLFGILAYLVWPFPIVYFIIKYDSQKAFPLILLAALANTFIFTGFYDLNYGLLIGLYTIIVAGLIGFLLGTSLKENFPPFKTLIITILAVLMANTIFLYMTPNLLGFTYQEAINELSGTFAEIPQLEDFSLILEETFYMIKTRFPAMLTMMAISVGSLIYFLSIYILEKADISVKKYKPFKEWFFPRWLISIGTLITLILSDNIVFVNLFTVFMFLLFLQGLAVFIFYLSKKNSMILYIILFLLIIPLSTIVTFIGLVDLWFDIRKIKSD